MCSKVQMHGREKPNTTDKEKSSPTARKGEDELLRWHKTGQDEGWGNGPPGNVLLTGKHGCLGSREQHPTPVVPALGRRIQEDLWSSLASLPRQLVGFSVSKRPSLKKYGEGPEKNTPNIDLKPPHACTHMNMHTHNTVTSAG